MENIRRYDIIDNNDDNIIKEIEEEYYKIIIKKDISDHKLIKCRETKTISWNIENDVGYTSTYVFDGKENNLDKFPIHLRSHINRIYGVGKNFRIQMEKSIRYYEILHKRYYKICEILKQNIELEPDYKICIQECSKSLFEYLKENIGLKYCKYIKQDTESIHVGKVKDLCNDFKNILHYSDYKNDLEINNPILYNIIKKYYNNSYLNNIEIWKKNILTNNELFNDYIDLIIDNTKEKYKDYNEKSEEQHNYGHAILSNENFIMLPCLSRMLYSNNFIIVENYDDCVGGFVVKSRGCYALGLDIVNVHLSKGRVGFDYEKISNRDFFSIDFELTRQIDKYLFGSVNDDGILKLLNNYYGNDDDILIFKETFINCMIKKLYAKFIDAIKIANYIELDKSIISIDKIEIEINQLCPIYLDMNRKNKNDNLEIKKYFITKNCLESISNYLSINNKLIFVGDFNDQVENIVGMFLKYYNIKLMKYENQQDKIEIYTGLIKNIYSSDRIDHILLIDYIDIRINKLEKYNNYVKKLVSGIEISKYELIKNNNIISWNVNCRNNCIYYFNPKEKLKYDIGLEISNNELVDKIVRNSIIYTLGEIKSKKILEEILDNITYFNDEPTTKIYLQEANFDLIKYLKDNLNYKFAKFVSECITNLHLLNFSSYLKKDNKIRETANVYYSNIYNNSNKLGYCIFSNTDFTVLPYSVNSSIEYKEDKDIFDIKINCIGCIDITNNIICINKYIGLDNIIKKNILNYNKITIDSINTSIFYDEDKVKLEYLINVFRNILFTKFIYIVKDYNYESSNKLNSFIEIEQINYIEYINKYKNDIFDSIYLNLLTDSSYLNTNEHYKKNNINKLIILGNYYKSNTNKEDKEFKPRFNILKIDGIFQISKVNFEEDLYQIPKIFKKKNAQIIIPDIEFVKNDSYFFKVGIINKEQKLIDEEEIEKNLFL